MWLPTDSEQTAAYEEMGTGAAFWLEHWLSLHGDDAFGLLKARPIGLRSLGSILLKLNAAEDRALARAMTGEIRQYQRLFALLNTSAPTLPLIRGRGPSARLEGAWELAAARFQDWDNHIGILGKLVDHLRKAISAENLLLITYLNRRLASEIADHYSDPRSVYIMTRKLALEGKGVEAVQNLVDDLSSLPTRWYSVSLQLAKVEVPAGVSLETSRAKLQFEESEEESPQTKVLIGVNISVRGKNHASARDAAMELCRASLTHLRLNFYVNTHMVGTAFVCIDEDTVAFPLRRPFWSYRGSRARDVPRFPPGFASRRNFADEAERARWYAAREHVSTAIATWSESCHHAASNVWQALESLAGGTERVYLDVIGSYERAVRPEIVRYIRRWMLHYSWIRVPLAGRTDWYAPPIAKVSDQAWLERVMSDRPTTSYKNWRTPIAPRVIFGDVGVLTNLFCSDGSPRPVTWPARRLELDLRHLYALRNHLVHRGERMGTDRWASYLGALGLEIIFSCAQAKS